MEGNVAGGTIVLLLIAISLSVSFAFLIRFFSTFFCSDLRFTTARKSLVKVETISRIIAKKMGGFVGKV